MADLKGILCINKPQNFTSFDVVAKLRGILGMKRIGHAGTLDPMATGVLPIFLGTATKACDILPDNDKTYIAEFKLGLSTDTQDIWGRLIAEKSSDFITGEAFEDSLEKFRGDIMQIPPMYSAVSVNGKRLYDLARQGIEVEREPRPITVYELELLSFNESEKSGSLKISCSKGTYIRTLINDIAESLDTLGVMTSLVRIKASGFKIDNCVTLEKLEKMKEKNESFDNLVLPVEKAFSYYPKLMLFNKQAKMYKNGVKLDIGRIKDFPNAKDGIVRVYTDGEFSGLARRDNEELRVYKNF